MLYYLSRHVYMNENLKFWITLVVGFIGACAWAPFIYEKFQINHFDGKVISVYNNFNKDRSRIFFLFKITSVALFLLNVL